MLVNLWTQRHHTWQGLLDLTSPSPGVCLFPSEHGFQEPSLSVSGLPLLPRPFDSTPNQQISSIEPLLHGHTPDRLHGWIGSCQ